MQIRDKEIIAIIRGVAAADAPAIAGALLDGGITTLEVSMTEPQEALKAITAIRGTYGSQLRLGAGTVLSSEMADQAVAAGAAFIITPGWDSELVKYCISHGLDILPGVFSPGEIVQGMKLGLTHFKLFPAANLGPSYIRNLKGPFPHLSLVGVGGIGLSDLGSYYRSGCRAFAIGSDLVPRGSTAQDYDLILNKAKAYGDEAIWN